MGQYYQVVNLDKKQYLHPHKFGDGLKLLEFGDSGGGTMLGLAVLLADGNNRGGGDLRSDNNIIGSWAGDRIVIAGDYADPCKFLEGEPHAELVRVAKECFTDEYQQPECVTLYAYAKHCFDDISHQVLLALADDVYIRQDIIEKFKEDRFGCGSDPLPTTLTAKLYPGVGAGKEGVSNED